MDNAQELPQDLPEDTSEKNHDDTTTVPEEAFLVIDGVKVFPLTESVVTIGRRLGNTLVIDDTRVSRLHAQLRAINNRYVLFDLESSGGTFLNGRKINQAVVYPGDVISLAGVDLIYGQKNPPPRPDLKQTWPFDK
jgi:pSer/pThr/pTyr-binding forkhead associated (FHA) protein